MSKNTIIILLMALLLLFNSCEDDPTDTSSDSSSSTSSTSSTNGTLMLNEIRGSHYSNSPRYIELYNSSSETADLGTFTLITQARDGSTYASLGNVEFTLPSVEISPGSYVVLVSNYWYDENEYPGTVNISNSNAKIAIMTSGFVELKKDGSTVDFVRFGSSTQEPATGTFTGTAPEIPINIETVGSSTIYTPYYIARDGSSADTDSGGDWTEAGYSTLGAPNDVEGTVDNDGDGIPDANEQPGKTFAGMPLYDWGARVDQRDIFIHVNYMAQDGSTATVPGLSPTQAALDKVRAVFADNDITLHIDVGNLFHPDSGISPDLYDLSDSSHLVPYSALTGLWVDNVSIDDLENYKTKEEYFPRERRMIFHYCLFVNEIYYEGGFTPAGLGELGSNDFLVGYGNLVGEPETTINAEVAQTFMHELGHNLGLHHGGGEETNYKPNYVSIMNYLYRRIPAPGDTWEAIPYYLYQWNLNSTQYDKYIYNTGHTAFTPEYSAYRNMSFNDIVIDFSHGTGGEINENSIVESSGLMRSGIAVDFNGDGSAAGTISMDVNHDGVYETLSDYDDWSNIEFIFYRDIPSSLSRLNQSETPHIWTDLFGNDQGEAIP